MTIQGLDEYAVKVSRLGEHSDETAKRAIYAGAGVVADHIRSGLERVLAGSVQSTGALAGSLGIAPIRQDEEGNWNTRIGFEGYDSKGVPNQLKARVLESGSSKQKKRPFVRPAVNASREAAVAAMGKVIDEKVEKIMK